MTSYEPLKFGTPQVPVNPLAKLGEVPLVIIDFETTDLSPNAKPIEICIVRYDWLNTVAPPRVFRSYLHTSRAISAEAYAVHGIADGRLKGAPTLEDVLFMHSVRELLRGAQPVAYGTDFDRRLLLWPAFHDILDESWPWLDVLTIVRAVDKYARGQGRHSLTAACARHEVQFEHAAHSALGDAIATGKLLQKLAKSDKLPEPTLEQSRVVDALSWCHQMKAQQWGEWLLFRAGGKP